MGESSGKAAMSGRSRGTKHGVDVPRARRGVRLAAVTGVIALAVLGFAAFEFASHVTSSSHPSAGAPPGGANGGSAISPSVPAPSEAAASTSPGPSATLSPRPTAPGTTPAGTVTGPVQVLPVVSAVAFGPNGTSDGDNPQLAADVLSDPSAGWMTDWYATPDFGGLAQGTGLLLDMGSTVTVATIRVDLGPTPGAAIELLAGAQPVAGTFQTLATRQDAGGLVTLTPATPTPARYVLLWFTKLPPDGNGTYQASVHGVTVEGQP